MKKMGFIAVLLVSLLASLGCGTRAEPETVGMIQVTPDQLDFGAIARGTAVGESVVIANVGGGALTAEASIVGNGVFSLEDSLPETRIAAGEDIGCHVIYSPDAAGDHQATLKITSDDLDHPVIEVSLTGTAVASAIQVTPETCEFGDQEVGCAEQIEFTITNTGIELLEIHGLELASSSEEFTETDEIPEGIALVEGGAVAFTIHYDRQDVVADTATLTIHTNDPEIPAYDLTCAGEAHHADEVTDTFEQHPAATDVLWVVDNSPDSLDLQLWLAGEFPAFLDSVTAQGIDYHVGVVTTDDARFQGSTPVMDSSTPDLASAFSEAVLAKAGGSAVEQHFDIAEEAITPPLTSPGGDNEGFLRDDANLRVIFVTDSEDVGDDTVTAYVNTFQSIKLDPDQVVLHGISGQTGGCTCDHADADVAPRLEQAIAMTDGVSKSVCELDWATMLGDLATYSLTLLESFELTQEAAADTTVTVEVDQTPVTAGWTFEPDQSAVIFDSDHVPAAGSTITVTYSPLVEC